MKKKTNELKKMEKQRISILTDDLDHCFICGGAKEDIHEIYCGRNRKVSMANGFCVPLCRSCHTSATLDKTTKELLQKFCQIKFEKQHSHAEFMRLIGKNYLIGGKSNGTVLQTSIRKKTTL